MPRTRSASRNIRTLICPICGIEFTASHASRKYCTPACTDRAHHLRRKEPGYTKTTRIDIHTRAQDKLKNFENVIARVTAIDDEAD